MGRKTEDLTGRQFSRLTVLHRDLKQYANKGNRPRWMVRCQCGKEFSAFGKCLRYGNTRSCGCASARIGQKAINYIGERFGLLTVRSKGERKPPHRIQFWICICDCGNETSVAAGDLRRGQTKSCGCLQRMHLRRIKGEDLYTTYRRVQETAI